MDTISSTNEQITHDINISAALKRPDKIVVKKSGYENVQFYFNGQKLVAYNPLTQNFASESLPGDINSLISTLGGYEIEAPMAEFFGNEPLTVLLRDVDVGRYIELSGVRGVSCHHIAFRQENVDWQLWVEAGETPLIRRFRITTKTLTGSPSYTVDFLEWQINPNTLDTQFEFDVPAGSTQVDFKELKP
jgi:hypothetical protein